MNWGYKIMLVYLLFVLGIAYMIYRSSQINTDLVTPDYYKKELAYQGVIEKQRHYNQLSGKMQVKQNDTSLIVILPHEMRNKHVDAKITLYCPSNQNKDNHVSSQTDQSVLIIPKKLMQKGYYTLQVDWKSDTTDYYAEQNLIIQ